jgi:hypothetical protein
MSALHRSASYQRRAKVVRDIANADPLTKCWVCHRTKAEHGCEWDAGHVIDGHPDSVLLPECSNCNRSKGARRGNQMRTQGMTRDW